MKFIGLFIFWGLIQDCLPQQVQSIQGKWVSIVDNHSVLILDKNSFCQLYKKDTVFCGKYSRGSVSCDSNYLKNSKEKNLDFIRLEDGTCYEITGITNSTLAYRHTESGRMQVFNKIRSR